MRYAVILAGGAGKRLWPLSRMARPKQLLPLLHGKTLLEMAVERLDGLFDNENIYIITNAEYAEQIAKVLPQLPPCNIVGEPTGKDTASAVALAAELLSDKDDATMAVFTADHVIRPAEQFAQTVEKALRIVDEKPDALVTFGVRATWPHPGLGYIHLGRQLSDGVHEVAGFKEKPDHQTARRYVESERYCWNSGMFVWKVSALCEALREFLPETLALLQPVGDAVRKGEGCAALLAEIYPRLQKISIDFAVMEKASNVLVVDLPCEWLDVGSWPSLENVTEMDNSDNVVVARNALVMDSFRNIIVSEDDHLLAVLGMDDCVVVHSSDATLVCNKSDSQRLKELVALLEKKHGRKYL